MKVFEIFNDTKYAKAYLNLIDKAKNREAPTEYVERHHIVPKSLGGPNDKENLVKLTPREHFVAHLLLHKGVQEKSHQVKMASALNRMLSDRYGNRYTPTSKMYAVARKAHADAMTGRDVSKETRDKISKAHKGKVVDQVARDRMAAAKKGKPGAARNPEWNAKVSASLTGKKASPEAKAKMSAAKLGKSRPPVSQDTKDKMAEARRAYWEKKRNAKSTD
jgi:transposase InsO family protein